MQPVTRYAKSGDVHIAYQVFGDGPINLVLAPYFVSNIEVYWEHPAVARWLLRLGSFARVAMFDKRGTGMSDRVPELPGLDQRMDDLRAVMDAADMEQAALLGASEGASLAALFAATYPARSRALILYGGFAQFSSWLPTEKDLAEFLAYIDQAWGSGGSIAVFFPSLANDPAAQQWMGRFERLGASPAAATELMRMNSQIDISNILPTIRIPTLVVHRTGDRAINVEGGRYLAEHIPAACYVELPGIDHPPFFGDNADLIADTIEEFLTAACARRSPAIGCSLRFSLLISLDRPRRRLHSATAVGTICLMPITLQSDATSIASAGTKSRRLATAFWPLSMGRHAGYAARAQLPKRFDRWASKSARDCTRASAKLAMTMWAASPSTSVHVLQRSQARARS
ncbi:pimeloyl-ACP methyl ester carboxylesterase [Bradyrhizobium sp. LM3.2]